MLSDLFIQLKEVNSRSSFFNVINSNDQQNFKVEGKGIALISFEDAFSDQVRKGIENFKNHFKSITIYDAGHIKNRTTQNILSIIAQFQKNKIIPIFLGISLDELGNIAAQTNYGVIQIANKITNLTHSNAFIKSNFIGYQRHLIDLEDIHEIESQLFNSMSLGKIRTNPFQTEPVLRDAELLYVNPNVLRSCDCPENNETLPTGLHAEELCQLMKYSGIANHLQALFFDISAFSNQNKISSDLVAECIWYLAEGVNMKMNDHPSASSDFSEFVVYSTTIDDDLIFLKHNQSQKWWIKKNVDEQNFYMACSYEEYETAIAEEISERIQKFLHQTEA